MKDNCVFCDIINNNKDSFKIYEDEILLALLDIDPINEGHILIVPKEHYLDIDDISNELVYKIFLLARRLVKTLKKVYNLDGYSILQNGGYFNDIGHFHLHIFPRYKGDGFNWNYSDEKHIVSNEIKDKILKELSKIE